MIQVAQMHISEVLCHSDAVLNVAESKENNMQMT